MVDPGPAPVALPKRPSAPALPRAPQHQAGVSSSPQLFEDEESGQSPVVESTLNSIVDAAVSNATLQEERVRVQNLINNLVSRVSNGEGMRQKEPAPAPETTAPIKKCTDEPSASSPNKEPVRSSRTASKAQGIPLNDHQVYTIGGGPVSWSQTSDSATVIVSVPSWVRKEHVVVRFKPGAVAVRIGFVSNGTPEFELTRPLSGAIDVDGSMWMLEGAGSARKLVLELEKGRARWWSRLFMADDPADYAPVVKNSPGSPLSPESETPAPPPPPQPSTVLNEDDSVPPPPDTPPSETESTKDESSGPVEGSQCSAAREVVDEIVEEVVASTERGSGVFFSPEGVRRQQKLLTAEDLSRMAEQYKEIVSVNGPGAAHAAQQLGMYYHHGIGTIPQNDALSAKYYKFALENGIRDPEAAFKLGLMYNQGAEGLKVDAEQAVRWWLVAARLGHAVSMFNLGVMAMNGNGCDMDPLAALVWFRKAHRLNAQLTPPQISKAQLAERMKIAEAVRKERAKANMSPEEKQRRRDAAMEDIKTVGYATVGIASFAIASFAIRHWWQNRL